MEKSEKEHFSIGTLEELSISDYIFHKRYTAPQNDKLQSTGDDSEVRARDGGEGSLAEHQTKVDNPEIVGTNES